MSSTVLCAVVLLACVFTFSAAQTSCKGRCGAEYYRGYMCQCDYSCLTYGECCKDFESQCTTKNSCKGRCGEGFKRGRLCSCDSDCAKYKQCCSDHKMHCDAEEPTLNEGTDPSTFSEENNADDYLIPLVSPTSYPQDDPSDDMYSQIFSNDEFSNNKVEDPEASPIPESTSGYGSSTADLPDQISTEPTQSPDTLEFSTESFTVFSQKQTTLSDIETTQADDSPSTLYPIIEKAPTENTDASDPTISSETGTTLPQPTTAADHVSRHPSPTSGPQTEYSPTADTPALQTAGQAEVQPESDILPDDPTVASSDEPAVTTLPFNTASYTPVAPVSTGATLGPFTVLENSQVTTISASTLDLTPNPEATTLNARPDDTEKNTDSVTIGPPSSLADLEDPSTSVSPAGPGDLPELEAPVTQIPLSTEAVKDDMTDEVTAGVTTKPLNVTPDPTKPTTPEATLKPQDKPDPYNPLPVKPTPAKLTPAKPTLAKPSSKPETKPLDTAQTLNIDNSVNYQAEDSNDTNLCSGRPVSAVTTLRNGTVVVFRGHYFWILDRHMVPGPARGITQVWGVPSPIDTVFTRCNCQGKTYIFRGSQYWRFENDVLDPNYPKVIDTGFDGLRGHITAALSVPQYHSRRESVYFFKRGGFVQKYSYQFGTSPTCGRKVQHVYTAHNRMARQAVSLLGQAVNIRTSWRGFPSTITAAVSIPSNREPEGFKYYVFSRSKSYNVRLDSKHPVIATPAANASPESNNFFKCQKTV
ncbi:proteoglycan 4b isoform X2 [Sander lucioperca]|uniref:Proteoglycan 4b n=1 Tax=Sander lucioperca TaxID=283035 RepID=A0A8D0D7H1_SANLU|nr:proteoglycan 4b isoform X2 [Sander lucioperca]